MQYIYNDLLIMWHMLMGGMVRWLVRTKASKNKLGRIEEQHKTKYRVITCTLCDLQNRILKNKRGRNNLGF